MMTPKDFVTESVSRDMPGIDYTPIITRFSDDKRLLRLLHASIGMSGETGELLDSLKKSMMYGKGIDGNHLLEECGDVLWYMAIMLHELDSSFEEVMQMNVEKLRKRYPDGFTEKDAIARKDKVCP